MKQSAGNVPGGGLALGSEEDLRQRLSLVMPEDTTRGLFLNGVLEAVRQLGGDAAMRHCLAESGEMRFVDLFNYPLGTLLRISYAGARLLSSETRGFAEVMRQMGYGSCTSPAISCPIAACATSTPAVGEGGSVPEPEMVASWEEGCADERSLVLLCQEEGEECGFFRCREVVPGEEVLLASRGGAPIYIPSPSSTPRGWRGRPIGIPEHVHIRIHSRGPKGGLWNQAWKDFKEARPNASPEAIYRHAGELIFRFELTGPVVPYARGGR